MLAGLAMVVALAAAARSTWSPCGQSMLSQINPIAEAGRGQRYRRTATWFVAGSTAGGLCLGGLCAGLAAALDEAGLSSRSAWAVAAAGALAAALVDSRLFGFGPPFVRRQVDENWLTRYRPWVYGAGFGWQIGVGFTTYVMTSAVPLTVLLVALSATPWFALAVGVLFGMARGLTVLLTAPLRTQDALYAFHRRFAARGEALRRTVIVVQLAVAVAAAWAAPATLFGAAVTALAIGLAAWICSRWFADRARTSVARNRLATDM
jgi:hypothetical protein